MNLVTKTQKALGRPRFVQKKEYRKKNHLLRPIRCPNCRMPTEQKQVISSLEMLNPSITRKCLACGVEFTRAESHRVFSYEKLFI